MKKTMLITFIVTLTHPGNGQVLNQSANWPNVAWTVYGTYPSGHLINNPTTSSTFTYDNTSAAWSGVREIFAESPIIDLTPTHSAGENYIYFTGDYSLTESFDFIRPGVTDTLTIEYWDADIGEWVFVYRFFENTVNWLDYLSCLNITYVTPSINIANFSALQLSSFKYRINYFNDNLAISLGWCLGSPSIVSLPCVGPSNLMASNNTATSAQIEWTETGMASTWDIEYGPEGYSVGTGNTINGITNSNFSISALTPESYYDFYVRSHCPNGGKSAWVGPSTFRTAILAPYHQDFEVSDIFDVFVVIEDWNLSGSLSDYIWIPRELEDSPNPNSGPEVASSGHFYLITDQSPATNTVESALLKSPSIDISNLNSPKLLFDYHMFGSAINRLIIQIDSGSGFIDIDSIVGQQQTNATDPWATKTIDLSSFTSDIRVAFKGIRNTGGNDNIAIDEFFVVDCPQPSSLELSNITTSSADFNWVEQGSATSWDIEWGLKDFTLGNGTFLTSTVPNSINFSGLTIGTEYDVYIRANCGGNSGLSQWVGPVTFRTNCDTIIAPYMEGFENSFNSVCWDTDKDQRYNWIVQTGGTNQPNTGPTGASIPADINDVNYMYANATYYPSTPGENSHLWSPPIDISGLSNPRLLFDYHMYGEHMGYLKIKVSDVNGVNLVDIVSGQQQVSENDPWLSRKVDLPAFNGIIRIGFEAIRGSGLRADIAIDDIIIEESVGLKENTKEINVNIFPNPNSGIFDIIIQTADINKLKIDVLNVYGKLVYIKDNFNNVSTVNEQIDLSRCAKGIYIVNVTSDKIVTSHKVLVK